MERISLKFKHMSTNTNKLMHAMLKNQNLLRYINYLGDYNPLAKRLLDVQLGTVKNENFILTKFNEDILEDNKILLFLNPLKGRFVGTAASDDIYTLDIIIPYEYWLINSTGELRAWIIAYEVAQSIDNKNVAGVGNVRIVNWESYKVNNKFSGLTLFIQVTNGTIIEG